MESKNRSLVVGLIIVVVVVLIGYTAMRGTKPGPTASSPVSSSGTLKLGFLAPLSGDAASYGEPELKAAQVAVDEINKAGGINGQQVELITEDGKCDPQAGGTAAQKLVNIDQVKVIIGGACSGETLAAAAITEPAHVILISPSASSPKITNAGDFVFRTYPSDALAGKVAAKYASETLSAHKAALITELTDYAQGLRQVYKDSFTSLGGTIIADETYNTSDTDFRTQVLKIKQSGADVVYVVPQSPTPGIAIFKQLKEAGVTGKMTTAEVLLDDQTVKDNAQALEGVIGVRAAADYNANAKGQAFLSAHRAKFGADPGSFAGNAYDAVMLIKDAITANGLDTAKIRDWLYAVKDWSGVLGSLNFDKNGDPILGESVAKISGGVISPLTTVAP